MLQSLTLTELANIIITEANRIVKELNKFNRETPNAEYIPDFSKIVGAFGTYCSACNEHPSKIKSILEEELLFNGNKFSVRYLLAVHVYDAIFDALSFFCQKNRDVIGGKYPFHILGDGMSRFKFEVKGTYNKQWRRIDS